LRDASFGLVKEAVRILFVGFWGFIRGTWCFFGYQLVVYRSRIKQFIWAVAEVLKRGILLYAYEFKIS